MHFFLALESSISSSGRVVVDKRDFRSSKIFYVKIDTSPTLVLPVGARRALRERCNKSQTNTNKWTTMSTYTSEYIR